MMGDVGHAVAPRSMSRVVRPLGMIKFPTRIALVDWLPKHGIVAEIGVACGEFASVIAHRAHPAELHLIDAWTPLGVPNWAHVRQQDHDDNLQRVRTVFAHEIASGVVRVHRGLSSTVLRQFTEEYFDWVYLDADHRHESVLADLLLLDSRVRPSGFIAGHDYVDPGVSPGARSGEYGVIRAVEEFCARRGWELVGMTAGIACDVDGADNPSYVLSRRAS